MMLTDLIATYLETQRILVARPGYRVSPAAVRGLKTESTPSIVTASLVFVNHVAKVRLRIIDPLSGSNGDLDLPPSDDPIYDALLRVANEFKLSRPDNVYASRLLGERELEALAESWQNPQTQPFALPGGSKERRDVIEALAKARIYSQRFDATESPEARVEAFSALEELRGMGVVTSRAYLLRARIARKEGNRAGGVQILRSGIEKLTTTAPLLRRLAEIQLAAGFAKEASGPIESALAQDPYSIDNYLTAERVYSELGQEEKAERLLRGALQLNGSNADIYTRLGVINIRLDRFEQSRQLLERATELEPTPERNTLLGLANLLCGNKTQAILVLQGAAAANPTFHSLATLGAALRWVGDTSSAKIVLAQARKLGRNVSSPSDLGILAMVYAQTGEIRKADELMARAIKDHLELTPELLYDGLVVDVFGSRRRACLDKLALLEERHYPMAFARRDPAVAAMIGSR